MLEKFPLALATFKGGMRDRLLLGLFIVALLLLFTMPLFSSFSMRDVVGIACTYSLSVISAIGVILVIFIGGALIPKDIQSRTIYGIATLPISRTRYLVEKYLGFALLLFCSLALIGCLNLVGLWLMAKIFPPDKPLIWANYFLFLFFDFQRLLVLAAVLVLLSALATSSFLPMIMTLLIYAIGSTTEKVRLFIETVKEAEKISPLIKSVVHAAYFLFPNLTLFDFKLQMIYALPVAAKTIVVTLLYGVGYSLVMLVMAAVAFNRRDFV